MTITDLKKAMKDLRISKKTSEKIIAYFEDDEQITELSTALYQERLRRRHNMVLQETPGTRGYSVLCWMHPIVKRLSDTYGRTYLQMARMYVAIGVDKMVKGYGINKFKYYNEDILNEIEKRLTIEDDDKPESTIRVFKYYARKVFEIWGEEITTITSEDKHHIIKLRQFIRSRDLNAREWIDSRFERYKTAKKPIPVYMLYAAKEEQTEQVDIKHSKLNKIING